MTNRHNRKFWLSIVVALPTTEAAKRVAGDRTRLQHQVQRELVTPPYYGVFDNLGFRLDGGPVALLGQMSRSCSGKTCGRAVERIEAVERFVNQIEVLPVSGTMTTFDSRPTAPSTAIQCRSVSGAVSCRPSTPL